MNYLLFIDLDERGEFRAHVEDTDGNEIFSYGTEDEEPGIWLVEAGYMKHGRDERGLTEYLVDMGIIAKGDAVVDGYGYEPDDDEDDEDDEDEHANCEVAGSDLYATSDYFDRMAERKAMGFSDF